MHGTAATSRAPKLFIVYPLLVDPFVSLLISVSSLTLHPPSNKTPTFTLSLVLPFLLLNFLDKFFCCSQRNATLFIPIALTKSATLTFSSLGTLLWPESKLIVTLQLLLSINSLTAAVPLNNCQLHRFWRLLGLSLRFPNYPLIKYATQLLSPLPPALLSCTPIDTLEF